MAFSSGSRPRRLPNLANGRSAVRATQRKVVLSIVLLCAAIFVFTVTTTRLTHDLAPHGAIRTEFDKIQGDKKNHVAGRVALSGVDDAHLDSTLAEPPRLHTTPKPSTNTRRKRHVEIPAGMEVVETGSEFSLFPVIYSGECSGSCTHVIITQVGEAAVNIRSAAFGTYLSREVNGGGIVSFHKPYNRSSERWERRPAVRSGGRGAPLSNAFHLYGVKSAFEPDAGDFCITLQSLSAQGESGARLRRYVMSRDTATCVEFYEKHVLATSNDVEIVENDSLATPTTQKKEDTSSDQKLVIVTTLPSLSKMGAEQAEDQVGILRWWVEQLLVIDQHVSMLICADSDDESDRLIDQLRIEKSDVSGASHFRTFSRGARAVLSIMSNCERSTFVEDIQTYRGLFAAAEAVAQNVGTQRGGGNEEPPLIMMVNSDIVFPSLQVVLDVLKATSRLQRTAGKKVLLTGQRRNCRTSSKEVFDAIALLNGAGSHTSQFASWEQLCPMFDDSALDYFVLPVGALRWNRSEHHHERIEPNDLVVPGSAYAIYHEDRPRGRSSTWDASSDLVPPFVVGGIAFDSWLLSLFNTEQDSFLAMDGTAVLPALHVGRRPTPSGGSADDQVRASHKRPASKFNSEIGHYCGGWARGKSSVAPYALLRYHSALAGVSALVSHQRLAVRCVSPSPAALSMLLREGCLEDESMRKYAKPQSEDAFFRPYAGFTSHA